MKRIPMLALLAAALLAGCRSSTEEPPAPPAAGEFTPPPILTTPEAKDVNSYANPLDARVTHVALDLAADFDRHVLAGTATLDIAVSEGADSIVLDDNGLVLKAITDAEGKALPYEVGARDPVHGAPLTVRFGDARRILGIPQPILGFALFAGGGLLAGIGSGLSRAARRRRGEQVGPLRRPSRRRWS